MPAIKDDDLAPLVMQGWLMKMKRNQNAVASPRAATTAPQMHLAFDF